MWIPTWLAVQVTTMTGLIAQAAPAAAAPATHAVVIPGPERARYVIRYGMFGDVGSVDVQVTPAPTRVNAAAPAHALQARGSGQGTFLGMSSFAKQITADVDPTTGIPRHWVHARRQGDKEVTDTSDQATPGVVSVLRRRRDRPDDTATMNAGAPVHDPLSLIMSLRTALPVAPSTFRVLDNRGLWVVTVTPAVREPVKVGNRTVPAVRLGCHAAPVDWAGAPDGKRDAQPFNVWLADDAYHTPLVVTAPMGLADVRIEATGVERALTPVEVALRVMGRRGVAQPGGLPPVRLDRPRVN